MARRSPARLLAPLALVGFVVALLFVVNSGSDGGSSGKSGSRPVATATAKPSSRKGHKQRKRYVVKAGDTPSGIAEKTGVPLSRILELNPKLDDQTLTVGDRIKLRP